MGSASAKHFYLKDRSGLYPNYPKPETEKLILTEAIIDAASLLQIKSITRNYGVLACFGTNGLTEEHKAAIQELKQLREVIFAFDADEAGRTATLKYAGELKELLSGVTISTLNLPDNEDLNSLSIGHDSKIFTHLLNKRTTLFSSFEKKKEPETPVKTVKAEEIEIPAEHEQIQQLETAETTGITEEKEKITNQATANFNTANPYKLSYTTETANYYVQGEISRVLDSMKITIVIENPQTLQKARNKTDLYEDKQIEKLCKDVSEKLNIRKDLLETDIYKLTDLLDEYRETASTQTTETINQAKKYTMTEKEKSEAIALANTP